MPATSLKERFPWTREVIFEGNVLSFSSLDEVTSQVDRGSYLTLDIRSAVAVPIAVSGQVVGVLGFAMMRSERTWTAETIHTMRVTAAVLGSLLARCESDEALRQTILQIEHKVSASGRTYAKISNIMPPMPKMPKLTVRDYERSEHWLQRRADYAQEVQRFRAGLSPMAVTVKAHPGTYAQQIDEQSEGVLEGRSASPLVFDDEPPF